MLQDKKVILCVDDEENPLLLRKLVLEKAGYDVITASSAEQALGVVFSRRIDIVLSDQLMPGSTGTELARQIKARRPDLPIILFSGVNEIPADAECADLFLSKVEGPATLCEKISMVLGGAITTREP
ncbi:MAG: response regulator [Candidatus Korobacteraceae bacterium]|jgi:CheY-like chemotaxis protein